MTTIPRAEIREIARRYDVDYELGSDPTSKAIRSYAAELRRESKACTNAAALRAEADDLDALADRYEEQAANAMWSHTDGITP